MLFAPTDGLTLLRAAPVAPEAPPPVIQMTPRRPARGWRARQFLKLLLDGSFAFPALARLGRRLGLMTGYGELRGRVIHADGTVTDYGLLGRRFITDAGVAYLAADMAGGSSDINAFRYHGFGTGGTAENQNQTALVTELTTQYASDNTRPTGSQASSTNTYTTVGTLSPDATVSITEHGIFTQAATGGGTMWDRTLFTSIGLVSGDSLQVTHVTTFPAGS